MQEDKCGSCGVGIFISMAAVLFWERLAVCVMSDDALPRIPTTVVQQLRVVVVGEPRRALGIDGQEPPVACLADMFGTVLLEADGRVEDKEIMGGPSTDRCRSPSQRSAMRGA